MFQGEIKTDLERRCRGGRENMDVDQKRRKQGRTTMVSQGMPVFPSLL